MSEQSRLLSQKARSSFLKGEYDTAANIYFVLASLMRTKAFDYNIKLCKEKADRSRHLGCGSTEITDQTTVASPKKNKLRAIAILDEISHESWKHEMTIYPISRKSFKEQISSSTSDFAFLESAWKANGGSWEYAFTSPNLKHNNAQALLEAIALIKQRMKIVFWNKEDPLHFEKFLPIAQFADLILTTDSNLVDKYKEHVPHSRVGVLPFAAQPRICNPSGRFANPSHTVCFAGSYYGVGHNDRREQMNTLLPVILSQNGDIYDRMSYTGQDRYAFPEIYKEHIKEAVPFSAIVKCYKKYKAFLNVNTIIDSPTMMSRRVYELLACGTPVISTPSLAIEEQFPGIVQIASNTNEANQVARSLIEDECYWERISHLGYREVHTKHTYAHRMVSIAEFMGIDSSIIPPLVSVIICTRRPSMIERIVRNLTSQTHQRIEVVLITQGFTPDSEQLLLDQLRGRPSGIRQVNHIRLDDPNISLGSRLNIGIESSSGDFVAKMDDDDFYFRFYLSDMLLPFSYGDYSLVGKKEIFMYLSGSGKTIRRFKGQRHRETDFLSGATLIFKADALRTYKFSDINRGEDSDIIQRMKNDGLKLYSADPYNFLVWRGRTSDHTWTVDDSYFLNGEQTTIESDFFNTSLVDF